MTSKDKAPTTERMPAATPRPREARPVVPFVSPEVTVTRPLAVPARPRMASSPRVAAAPSDRVRLPEPTLESGPASRAAGEAPLPGWVFPYVIFALFLLIAGLLVWWTEARVLGHF